MEARAITMKLQKLKTLQSFVPGPSVPASDCQESVEASAGLDARAVSPN